MFFFSCKKSPNLDTIEFDDFVEQVIILNSSGDVIETTIDIDHFAPSQDCQACHQQHYNEWQNSMHSHSFMDPIFMSLWNHEKEHRPNTGEKYCIQCHAPSAFVSDFDSSYPKAK